MPPSSYRIGVVGSYRWAAARATQAGPILLVPKSFERPGYVIRPTDRARRAVHRAARTRRESAAQENPLRPARIPCVSKRSLPPTYPSLHERPRCATTWHCSRSTPPVGWARAGGARGLSDTTRTSSRSSAWRECARTSARRWTEPSGSSQRVTIVEQPIVGDKGIDTAFYVSGWQVHPAHRSSGLGRRMHDVLQCGGARLADTARAHQSRIFFTNIPASGLRLRGHGAFYIQLRRWADDGHERIGISGRVTQVAADSVLVRVAELRDSTGPTLRYEPQRETWLVRGLGVVEARNTDTGRTLIMVVLAAATVAAVIAAANAPQPTPKPSGGVSCW